MFVGAVLIVASLLGVYLVVLGADRSEVVYTVSSAVPAGTALDPSALVEVSVDLGERHHYYLSPHNQSAPVITRRALAAGELVPLSALMDERLHDRSTLVIEPALPLAATIAVGTRVDLWATGADRSVPPRVLVEGAEVRAVSEKDGFLSVASAGTVEVVVPDSDIPVILSAIAAEDAIAVIAEPAQ